MHTPSPVQSWHDRGIRVALGVALAVSSLVPVLTSAQGHATLPPPTPTFVLDGDAYYRDIVYATVSGVDLELDVIKPVGASGRIPVVIHLPGGAPGADKSFGYGLLSTFTRAGYAFVPVSRDPVGTNPSTSLFLQELHTTKAAIRWVWNNAERYGLDRDRVALLGFSAGSYVAGFAGVTGNDPQWEGSYGRHTTGSTRVQAVIATSGTLDLEINPNDCREPGQVREWGSLQQCIDGFQTDSAGYLSCPVDYASCLPLIRQSSAITHVSAGDPPFLLTLGSADTVPLGQSERFRDALQRAGVPVELHVIPGVAHDIQGQIDAQPALYVQFLDRYLRGTTTISRAAAVQSLVDTAVRHNGWAPQEVSAFAQDQCFVDVAPGAPSTAAICFARAHDWVRGDPSMSFRSNDPLSIIDAVQWVLEAFQFWYAEELEDQAEVIRRATADGLLPAGIAPPFTRAISPAEFTELLRRTVATTGTPAS